MALLRRHNLQEKIMSLKGCTARITGTAQGISLACAKAMAADGVHVILANIKDDVVTHAARIGICFNLTRLYKFN